MWLKLEQVINYQPKTYPCVFIGYGSQHKGYRCLHPSTRKVYITRHVVLMKRNFLSLTPPILKFLRYRLINICTNLNISLEQNRYAQFYFWRWNRYNPCFNFTPVFPNHVHNQDLNNINNINISILKTDPPIEYRSIRNTSEFLPSVSIPTSSSPSDIPTENSLGSNSEPTVYPKIYARHNHDLSSLQSSHQMSLDPN